MLSWGCPTVTLKLGIDTFLLSHHGSVLNLQGRGFWWTPGSWRSWCLPARTGSTAARRPTFRRRIQPKWRRVSTPSFCRRSSILICPPFSTGLFHVCPQPARSHPKVPSMSFLQPFTRNALAMQACTVMLHGAVPHGTSVCQCQEDFASCPTNGRGLQRISACFGSFWAMVFF